MGKKAGGKMKWVSGKNKKQKREKSVKIGLYNVISLFCVIQHTTVIQLYNKCITSGGDKHS